MVVIPAMFIFPARSDGLCILCIWTFGGVKRKVISWLVLRW